MPASAFSSSASSTIPSPSLSRPSTIVLTVITSLPAPPAIVVGPPMPLIVIVSLPPPAQIVSRMFAFVSITVNASLPSSATLPVEAARPSARRRSRCSIPSSSIP